MRPKGNTPLFLLDDRRQIRRPSYQCISYWSRSFNVIRIDLVTESLNVSADGRAAMFLPDAVGVCTENFIRIDYVTNRLTSAAMIALLCFFLTLFASPFKSKSRLEAENAALRHQLIILRRRVRGRVRLTNGDRLFLSSCIDGFHQSSRPSRSSAPRPSCDGIEPASAGTGVGNPARLEADRRSLRICAR